MISQQWVMCPVCGNKTRTKIRKDTKLINFPLYCPKCKERKSNQCKESNSNHCKRARRKDAEPITPRMSENFLGYRLILFKS